MPRPRATTPSRQTLRGPRAARKLVGRKIVDAYFIRPPGDAEYNSHLVLRLDNGTVLKAGADLESHWPPEAWVTLEAPNAA